MTSSREASGFDQLVLSDWRQFEAVHLDLTSRATIITGANGSGKSTILSILSKHFNWQAAFASVSRSRKQGVARYSDADTWSLDNEDELFADVFESPIDRDRRLTLREMIRQQIGPRWSDTQLGELTTVGSIRYDDGGQVMLGRPEVSAPQYELIPFDRSGLTHAGAWRQLPGVFISSFRSPITYAQLDTIPAGFSTAAQLLQQYVQEVRNRHFNLWSGQPNRSPFTAFKESLVAAAVYGGGSEAVEPNHEARRVWEGYQHVLRAILPNDFGFDRLMVRAPDVNVRTVHGRVYALESVSGGIGAMMELSWQVFLQSMDHDQFTVLIDEPENHLHPSLQRTLLPSLLNAFPTIRFILSTHSPFIVGAVHDARVYVLRSQSGGGVTSEQLDLKVRASGSERILREVLGVPVTLPVWAEDELDAVVKKYAGRSAEEIDFVALRRDLSRLGMDDVLPEVNRRLVDQFIPGQGRNAGRGE